ncbi:MAG: hypothetical protein RIE53_01855 [Rhodothermales bacterium]
MKATHENATRETTQHENTAWNRFRIAAWSGAAFLLLLPLIAMQFTEEVNWTASDFMVMGAMLLGAGGAFELALRTSGQTMYRIAAVGAVGSGFFMIWVNGAVGIVGNEDNLLNVAYFGVLALGFLGATACRLKPRGMARTGFTMAGATALIGAVALVVERSAPGYSPVEIIAVNAMFVVLFTGVALLFNHAADDASE